MNGSTMISPTASAMITNNDANQYIECKMYDSNDVYLTDLSITGASWSKSNKFGVSVLNIQVINSSGIHNIGATYEIKQDYKVVLIEGFDTGITNDHLPTFKGYIKDIKTVINVIDLTIYDELIITQRSDLDKIYKATTILATDETLVPVVEDIASTVYQTPDEEYIRFKYVVDSFLLDNLIGDEYFYVDTTKYKITNVNLLPNGTSTSEVFIDGSVTGTLIATDQIETDDRRFTATIGTSVNGTYSRTGEATISLATISGYFSDGDILYKVGDHTVFFTVKSFYEVKAQAWNSTIVNPGTKGVTTDDVVHNGRVNSFRAAHPNWATFKTHSINITHTGDVTDDDEDSGYEVSHQNGVLRFNDGVDVDEYDVKASYSYHPVGLYIEDVIEDIVTTADPLVVNKLENNDFRQSTTSWSDWNGGGALSSDFNTSVNNGLELTINNDLGAGEYVGVQQTGVDVLANYTYSISGIIQLYNGDDGKFNVVLINGGVNVAEYTNDGSDLISPTSFLFTYTPTSSIDGLILAVFVSGVEVDASDVWKLSNITMTYNPARTNALTTTNLYTTIGVETGSAATYSLQKNTAITITPRFTFLRSKITYQTTTITLASTSTFTTTGTIKIDDEYITYTGKTATTLTGITRAAESTTQVNHDVGVRVWEALEASRIWYMQFSNIIPKTTNTTASTFDGTNGVNVGSGGSFTITGSTFKEFWYRQGMMITNDTATEVVLDDNQNYYFSQLQSTGIEVPFILINYRELKTKFDALNEIRSLLAPNYIINSVVRRNSGAFITYIKGRYLTQKSTGNQDYELDFLTNITYEKDNNSYNRVKMFGKNANPVNLMYDSNTTVIPANDLDSEYLRGVEYKYIVEDGTWYIYYSDKENRMITSSTLNGISPWVNRYGGWVGQASDNYISIVKGFPPRKYTGADNTLMRISNFQQDGGADGSSLVAGVILSVSTSGSRQNIRGRVYNVYYINYTVSGTSFSVGDSLGSGIIKYSSDLDSKAPYDAYIMVEHDRGKSVFTGSQSINNGTVVATVFLPGLDGFTSQVNYNTPYRKRYRATGFYNIVFNPAGLTRNITKDELAAFDKYTLKINDYSTELTNATWNEELIELGSNDKFLQRNFCGNWQLCGCMEWRNDAEYRKVFGGKELYLNPTSSDYTGNISDGREIPNGTVRFEQHTGSTVNKLLTLKYDNEPGYSEGHRRYGNIWDQLKNGTYLAFTKRHGESFSNLGQPEDSVRDATHVRYTRRRLYDVDWDISAQYVRILKADLNRLNLKPEEIKVTLDGPFIIKYPDEYFTSDNRSTIQRLRDFKGEGVDEQVGLLSKLQIIEAPLFVIDLGSVKRIKYINVQGGKLYKPSLTKDTVGYYINFKFSIKHTAKDLPFTSIVDTDFSDINSETNDIELSTGEVTTLDESKLGETFETRYLKFYVNTTDKVEEGTESTPIEWYEAAIAGVAIYESDIISSEKYVDDKVINLFKDSTVYEQLYTQELLDNYAQQNITEFQKDNTIVSAASPYSPHLEVGMTVRINDSENLVDRNYFIESLSSANGVMNIKMAYYA